MATVKDAYRTAFTGKRSLPKIYWKVLEEIFPEIKDSLPSRSGTIKVTTSDYKQEPINDNNKGTADLKPNQELGKIKDQLTKPDYTSTDGLIGGRYMRRGSTNYNRGNYGIALADYDKVVELLPSSPLAYYNRGQIKCRMENWAGALKDFQKVTELDPDATLPYCKCFDLMNVLKDGGSALPIVNKIIDLEPKNALAFMYRSLIKAEMGDSRGAALDKKAGIGLNPELAGKIFIGSYYLPSVQGNQGNPGNESGTDKRTAYRDFQVSNFATLIINPPESKGNETKVPVKNRTRNNKKDSLIDVGNAIKLNPSQSDNNILRARNKADAGDFRGAIADVDLAISHQPNNDYYYYIRYEYNLQSDDMKGALNDLCKAIECNPSNGDYYRIRAPIRLMRGDLVGALDDATKNIDLYPCHAPGYTLRAAIEGKRGDYDLAIADYTSAIERDLHYVLAYCNRGILKLQKKDMDGALADFNNAIQSAPHCPAGYYYRARHSLITDSFDPAFDDLVKAYILMSPRNKTTIQDILDRSYKQPKVALVEYENQIKANPKDSDAHFILGHLRDILGDKKNAVADLQVAFDIKNESDPNKLFDENPDVEGPIIIKAASFT